MKTIKTFQIVFAFTLLAFISLGCNEKKDIHNHHHYTLEAEGRNTTAGPENTNGPSLELGGESHGGDVLYARAEEIRFLLTATEQEVDDKYLQDEPWYIRKTLTQVFEAMRYHHNVGNIKDEAINSILTTMLEGNDKGDIFYDIENVSFNVLMPEAPGESSFWDRREKCRDIDGNESTAAAKLSDVGGEICVDAERLAKEAPMLADIVALLGHELSHHFGADEAAAHTLQNYILANYGVLQLNGFRIEIMREDHNLLDITNIYTEGEVVELEVKTVFKDLGEHDMSPEHIPIFTRPVDDYMGSYAPGGIKDTEEYYPLPEEGETKIIEYSNNSKPLRGQVTLVEARCGIVLEVKVRTGNFGSETFEVNGGRECSHNTKNWKPGPLPKKYYLYILL